MKEKATQMAIKEDEMLRALLVEGEYDAVFYGEDWLGDTEADPSVYYSVLIKRATGYTGYNGYLEKLNIEFGVTDESGTLHYLPETDEYVYTLDSTGEAQTLTVKDGVLYLSDGRTYQGAFETMDWLFETIQVQGDTERSEAAAGVLRRIFQTRNWLNVREEDICAYEEYAIAKTEQLLDAAGDRLSFRVGGSLYWIMDGLLESEWIKQDPDLLGRVEQLYQRADAIHRSIK
jgi:hypothetical protein